MITDRFTVFVGKEARDSGLLTRLKHLARKRRRSVSFMAVEAIEEYLKRHGEDKKEAD